MCQKLKDILFTVLFLCLSVPLLHSQSAKQTMIDSLSECQIKLQKVKLEIISSKQKIADLQSLIDNLNQQLTDSKNNSQIAIDNLRLQLQESERLLEKQRQDLTAQEVTLTQLSQELTQLKNSSKVYRRLTYIFGGLSIAMGGYIGGHIAGWW